MAEQQAPKSGRFRRWRERADRDIERRAKKGRVSESEYQKRTGRYVGPGM